GILRGGRQFASLRAMVRGRESVGGPSGVRSSSGEVESGRRDGSGQSKTTKRRVGQSSDRLSGMAGTVKRGGGARSAVPPSGSPPVGLHRDYLFSEPNLINEPAQFFKPVFEQFDVVNQSNEVLPRRGIGFAFAGFPDLFLEADDLAGQVVHPLQVRAEVHR